MTSSASETLPAAADIDWATPVRRPRWLSAAAYGAAVSQLYHGERATARICRRLMDAVDDPALRDGLRAQARDEARHAALYRAYLARVGDLAPMDPALAAAFEAILAWPGSHHGPMVAVHVVVEGEALRLFDDLGQWFPCPLLRHLHRLIAADEARHVAFGETVLRRQLAAVPMEHRRDIAAWVEGLWRACARATLARGRPPARVPRRLVDPWLDRRWTCHSAALARIGLTASESSGP